MHKHKANKTIKKKPFGRIVVLSLCIVAPFVSKVSLVSFVGNENR